MKISRDSAILWMGMAGAVVMYLMNAPNPVTWTYNQWLQAVSAAILGVLGILRTSPLASKETLRMTHPQSTVLPVMLLLGMSLVAVNGCAPKTITDPQTRLVFNANEAAIRVGRLQTATIDAEAAHAIPTDLAREIITWTVATEKAIRVSPSGWYPPARVAWDELNKRIPESIKTNPTLIAAWAAVETIIAVYKPEGAGHEPSADHRTREGSDFAGDRRIHQAAARRDGEDSYVGRNANVAGTKHITIH